MVRQNKNPKAADAGEHAGISEAKRQERLTQLVLRRSKLSPDEAALLREVFPAIVAAHRDQVYNLLRKRGLQDHDAEEQPGRERSTYPRLLRGLVIGRIE